MSLWGIVVALGVGVVGDSNNSADCGGGVSEGTGIVATVGVDSFSFPSSSLIEFRVGYWYTVLPWLVLIDVLAPWFNSVCTDSTWCPWTAQTKAVQPSKSYSDECPFFSHLYGDYKKAIIVRTTSNINLLLSCWLMISVCFCFWWSSSNCRHSRWPK